MVVKACFKNENYNYFVDKENGIHRNYGDLFECDDELAEERIKKGLVKKATKKEEKEYCDNIVTLDESDLKPINNGNAENNTGDNGETDNNEGELSKNVDEYAKVKSLEECTDNELWEIVRNETIEVNDSVSRDELIKIINKARAEKSDN